MPPPKGTVVEKSKHQKFVHGFVERRSNEGKSGQSTFGSGETSQKAGCQKGSEETELLQLQHR